MTEQNKIKYYITGKHIDFNCYFNEKLDSYLDLFRQNDIKSIHFCGLFNQSINILPDNIESIKIGSINYYQPIKKLPKDLKSFQITIFTNVFAIDKFPENLNSLSINISAKSIEFQTKLLDLINTCCNLKKLKIVVDENWQIGFGNLPSTLEELEILNLSNYKDSLSNLPLNLKILRCGIMCSESNKDILQMLPHGVEKLYITGSISNVSLALLPISIKFLLIDMESNTSFITLYNLADSIEILEIINISYYKFPQFNRLLNTIKNLSSNIKEIHFSYKIDSEYSKGLNQAIELDIQRKIQKKLNILDRKDIKICNITTTD